MTSAVNTGDARMRIFLNSYSASVDWMGEHEKTKMVSISLYHFLDAMQQVFGMTSQVRIASSEA
jgi:hypothetical protein